MNDETYVYGWATDAPEVHACETADPSMTCRFERRVRDRGPVVRDESVRGPYELVFFENGTNGGTYYRVTGSELANGSYAHELERIGPREALSVASLDADPRAARFRRLLERGEIETTTPLIDWEVWAASDYHLLEYDGQYYRQAGFSYRGSRHRTERAVRFFVGFAGLVLVGFGLDRVRHS